MIPTLTNDRLPPVDFARIRRENPIAEVIGGVLPLKRAGREYVAICPFHAEKSPSFTVVPDKGFAHCFGCGWSGDVLDFLCRFHGVALCDAANRLDQNLISSPPVHASTPVSLPAGPERARSIWQRTVPAAGTLAEAYLDVRGIDPPFPPDIRFARLACDDLGALPCVVAAVRDVAGDVTGIQRIFLRGDGQGKADVPTPKRSLGRVKGGAIRLGDLDGSGVLTVCEGPEDGLSLLEMGAGPVWVAAGATFLAHMQFPPDVHSIIIGADNDPAGAKAAQDAACTFAGRGLSVRIIRPLDGVKDFNDELRGAR